MEVNHHPVARLKCIVTAYKIGSGKAALSSVLAANKLCQRRLVKRFQRLPDMKAGLIEVSVFLSAGDFKPPYLETEKNTRQKKNITQN